MSQVGHDPDPMVLGCLDRGLSGRRTADAGAWFWRMNYKDAAPTALKTAGQKIKKA